MGVQPTIECSRLPQGSSDATLARLIENGDCVREPEFRSNATFPDPTKHSTSVRSAALYRRSEENGGREQPCRRCARSAGRFELCVALREPTLGFEEDRSTKA